MLLQPSSVPWRSPLPIALRKDSKQLQQAFSPKGACGGPPRDSAPRPCWPCLPRLPLPAVSLSCLRSGLSASASLSRL